MHGDNNLTELERKPHAQNSIDFGKFRLALFTPNAVSYNCGLVALGRCRILQGSLHSRGNGDRSQKRKEQLGNLALMRSQTQCGGCGERRRTRLPRSSLHHI